MIQLHRLEGFYRVALARSYTRAAREFPYPISQPGVYQQVRKLEQELGTPLFERAARDRVEPTAAGRALLAFCAPFFEQLPGVARSIAEGRAGGVLRIDAAPLEIRQVLPPWLRRLRRARPDIELRIEEVQTPDPARLRACQTDLIVDHLPEPPPFVHTRRIGAHRAFLVLPASWRAPASRARLRALLRQRPFVGYSPSLFQHALQLHGLQRLGIEPQPGLSASSTEAILGFVQAELGYSLLPWPSERGPQLAGVCCIRLRGAGTEFPIVLAWRARAAPDPLIEAALATL
jgi:DNA-binding transcriptional LysR family regulator